MRKHILVLFAALVMLAASGTQKLQAKYLANEIESVQQADSAKAQQVIEVSATDLTIQDGHTQLQVMVDSSNVALLEFKGAQKENPYKSILAEKQFAFNIVSILRGLCGMIVIILISWLLSVDRKRINWGCRGGFVSNWGSNEDEYMQRNLQLRALIATAYAFWSEDYDYDRRDELLERTMQEGYRLRLSKLREDSIIKVEHTTDYYEKYKFFYDGIFIEDSVYLLGNYELTYSDGTTALLPVRYGTHLTTCHIDDPVSNQSYSEMIGGTRPKKYGDVYYYECAYENPNPDKQIVGIKYVPVEDKKDANVYIRKIVLPEVRINTAIEDDGSEKAHIFQ